jgi:hypothetical protein
MKAFVKTLFGDARNIAGVALVVAMAAGLTGVGHPAWAVFAMPVVGLGPTSTPVKKLTRNIKLLAAHFKFRHHKLTPIRSGGCGGAPARTRQFP